MARDYYLPADDVVFVEAVGAEFVDARQFLEYIGLAGVIATTVVAKASIFTLGVAESNQEEGLAGHGAATSGMCGIIVHQGEWVSGIALRVLHQDDRLQIVGPPGLGYKQSSESFGSNGAEIVKSL